MAETMPTHLHECPSTTGLQRSMEEWEEEEEKEGKEEEEEEEEEEEGRRHRVMHSHI